MISLDSINTKFEILFNNPLENSLDEYQCQFRLNEQLFYTTAILLNEKTIKCLPPILTDYNQGKENSLLKFSINSIFV